MYHPILSPSFLSCNRLEGTGAGIMWWRWDISGKRITDIPFSCLPTEKCSWCGLYLRVSIELRLQERVLCAPWPFCPHPCVPTDHSVSAPVCPLNILSLPHVPIDHSVPTPMCPLTTLSPPPCAHWPFCPCPQAVLYDACATATSGPLTPTISIWLSRESTEHNDYIISPY